MQKTSPGLKNWLLLIILAVIWGASFMGVKIALTGFGPISVAAARIGIAAVVLTTIAFARGNGLPDRTTPTGRRIWLHCLGMGLFTNAIPFYLLSWGQLHVTSGFAGITMAAVPLLVLPLAHVFVVGEQLSFRKTIGFLIGFAGVLVLIGPRDILAGGGGVENFARLACIGASACYAIGAIITRLCPKTPLLSFSAGALIIASVVMVPMALYFEGIPQSPDTSAWLGILYLGLMPTALATVLLVTVITSAGPSFLSLVNYQVPVWAVIFGTLVLQETLPSQFLGALALILAGLAVSQTKLGRPLASRAPE